MDIATRQEIVKHACRWSANMLAEVLSNHGEALPAEARDLVRRAAATLTDVPHAIARNPLRIPQNERTGASAVFGALPGFEDFEEPK